MCRRHLGKATKGRIYAQRTYAVKSCGKAHSWCAVCNPAAAIKQAARIKAFLAATDRRAMNEGHRWTPAQRAKLKTRTPAQQAQFLAYQAKGQAAARWSRRQPTRIHQELYRFLRACGFHVACEVRFGRYRVDLYDPTRNIAFEADGRRWHKSRQARWKDRVRDRWLVEEGGLAAVVRFDEADIGRFSAVPPPD